MAKVYLINRQSGKKSEIKPVNKPGVKRTALEEAKRIIARNPGIFNLESSSLSKDAEKIKDGAESSKVDSK